jgi:hypothetical protein
MNKYCKIYKNKKNVLFIIDTASELQFIKELVFLNKFDETIENPYPEILFLKSTFSNLLEKNIILSKLIDYFNDFQHIILNLDYCINIQILSSILNKYNVSTHYPLISNNLYISYKKIYNYVQTYNLNNIVSLDSIKTNYISFYLNDIPPIEYNDIINKNIYENYYKLINMKTIDFRDNLTSIEREIINHILINNLYETTCIDLYHAISNKFHVSLTNRQVLNYVKVFFDTYAYNNKLNIFIPKTYIINNTTTININLLLLKALFLDNTYMEFKNDKIYFSLIPIILYSLKTFYQYNLQEYIEICIKFLMNKSNINFTNTPLAYENNNISIKREHNRIKIVSKYENNILYQQFPKYNIYKALRKFNKFDSKLKYIDNKFIFSKPINKKYYIAHNKLSHKILYKNSYYTLFDLTKNYELYTIEHLSNTLAFLEFIISIKFIEYLHSKSLINYRNIIFNYFATKFNNIKYYSIGLIFPYDLFFISDNLPKIFNNYKVHELEPELINFYISILKNNDILNLTYTDFFNIIYRYSIDTYIDFLQKILVYNY